MNRHVEIKRSPMPRTAWPAYGVPRAVLRPVSVKRAAENRERRKMADENYGDQPACGIRWDDDCEGLATDLHEPGQRSHGADITDAAECVPGCRHCHDMVHAHPAEAYDRGWLIRSGRPRKAVAR